MAAPASKTTPTAGDGPEARAKEAPAAPEQEAAPGGDAASASTEPQDHPFSSVFDPLLKAGEFNWTGMRNLNAASQAATSSVQGSMKLVAATSDFWTCRMRRDFEFVTALTGAKPGEEALRTAAGFYEQMLRDYSDHASRMTRLMAEVMQTTTRPLENRAEEALHSYETIPEHNGHFV